MATKSKPSKLPTRTVYADDLAVEIDGQTYYPHAGESVTFRGRPTVGDSLLAMRLQGITVETDAAEAAKGLEELIESLRRKIVEWDWTDESGEPYPSPPTDAALRSLGMEEIAWLVSGGRPVETEAASKND